MTDTWGKSGNITVGIYSDKTLEDIKSGKNKWAATVFMNSGTFSEKEIKFYPYRQRKQYIVYLKDVEDPIVIYATDARNARRFVNKQYKTGQYPIVSIDRVTIKQRRVMRKR